MSGRTWTITDDYHDAYSELTGVFPAGPCGRNSLYEESMKNKHGLGCCGKYKCVTCANNDPLSCGRCIAGEWISTPEKTQKEIPVHMRRFRTREEMIHRYGSEWRHNAFKIGDVPFYFHPDFDDLLGAELSGAVVGHFASAVTRDKPFHFRFRGKDFVIVNEMLHYEIHTGETVKMTPQFRRYTPAPPETVEDLTGKMLGIFDPVDRLYLRDRVKRPKNVLGIGSFEANNFKS